MKTIKILLTCVVVLLGIVMCLQLGIGKNGRNDVIKTSDMVVTGSEYSQEYANNVTSVVENDAQERIVVCKACQGQGHNCFEVNGQTCTVCDGKGRMSESEMAKRYEKWVKEEIVCPICGGTGLSYEARVTPILDRDLIAPQGHYNCKGCNGNKKGTRGQLLKNFQVSNEVYGVEL